MEAGSWEGCRPCGLIWKDLLYGKEVDRAREIGVISGEPLAYPAHNFLSLVALSIVRRFEEKEMNTLRVLVVMASHLASSGVAHAQIASLEQEVRNLCKLLRDQNWAVLKLDAEGGRRFDLVDKDLSHLHEDTSDEINHKIHPYSKS